MTSEQFLDIDARYASAKSLALEAAQLGMDFYRKREALTVEHKGDDLQDDTALPYTADIVSKFPSPIKNTSQVVDAVALYRKVLAAQPDRSVTISSIGMLTNLKALLQTSADEHSELSGRELVARKVRHLAVMGGGYPKSLEHEDAYDHAYGSVDGGNGCECNFCGAYNGGKDHAVASAASAYMVANMPPEVNITYSGFEVGIRVLTGGALSKCSPASNPCRQAFIDYEGGEGKSRFSWDPLTTLVAVRGPEAAACSDCNSSGANSVDAATGQNTWVPGKASNQTYLLLHDADAAAAAINELLCRPPRPQG